MFYTWVISIQMMVYVFRKKINELDIIGHYRNIVDVYQKLVLKRIKYVKPVLKGKEIESSFDYKEYNFN